MPDDEKDKDKDKKGKYGEDNYKSQGSPMFTKLWGFEELQVVERPGKPSRTKIAAQRDFKRPDSWPADTEVEPGKWVFWLPEGWGQGIRTQVNSGKKLSCYMNPQGKRYWHKKDIEKALGYALPSVEKKEEDDEEKEKDGTPRKIRYVTDEDAIPNWPEDDVDWLPKDWKIAFRQLPSGLHRMYVPPGYEEIGFLYHRATVQDWLAGKVTTVSSFGNSRPMAEISAIAMEKGTSSSVKKKRRHTSEAPQAASPTQFEAASGMGVVRLEGASHLDALKGAEVQDAEKLATEAKQLQEVLANRSFESTTLLYVFQRGEAHPVSVAGFYYKRPATWNEHDAYQKIALAPEASAGAACSALHLCWSAAWEGHWKIGKMDSDALGRGYLAVCEDSSMKSGWRLPRKDLIRGPGSSNKAAKTSE